MTTTWGSYLHTDMSVFGFVLRVQSRCRCRYQASHFHRMGVCFSLEMPPFPLMRLLPHPLQERFACLDIILLALQMRIYVILADCLSPRHIDARAYPHNSCKQLCKGLHSTVTVYEDLKRVKDKIMPFHFIIK
jgi:hypothetical protein